ncbi:aminotransferase class V-fold PLP-dependent enzyme [bacterium]|nr:aminotransferase class V-fold PLP-dependent enzyme [bacterium]
MRPLTFKLADQPWELEEIGRLLYRTFVEEIPQHPPNPERTLTDKFHGENVYLVALEGSTLAGMMAIRDRRPFSLDGKLPELDHYLPPHHRVCELRLLAVRPEYRGGRLTQQLLARIGEYCIAQGFDLAVISGTTRQLKLYSRMGFIPFGPLVGTPGAWYQPMYLTLERFTERRPKLSLIVENATRPGPVNLLPGPVAIAPEVARAFAAAPLSHRSSEFQRLLSDTRRMLCEWTGADAVEILTGSGTLANDVVAAQLSLLSGRGLVLSNGEFGERLIDHAARFNLDFETLSVDWGRPLDYAKVESLLMGAHSSIGAARCATTDRRAGANPNGFSWLWFVHCETSTGIQNDLPRLVALARAAGLRLAVDCVSSLGTMPIDLSQVYLASAVSGKALGSYPGLTLVFHQEDLPTASRRLPRYLDLALYDAGGGVPFTLSSNQLAALHAAIQVCRRRPPLAEAADWLREELVRLGLPPLAGREYASPAVFTLTLPPDLSAEALTARLESEGFHVAARSRYLLQRNWLQVALYSHPSQDDLVRFVRQLERLLAAPLPLSSATA